MGYGVIGNTKVSGSFVLGSSPGIPANLLTEVAAPSYSGLVLRPLTAATPVQIRLGSPLGKKPGFFGSQVFCLYLYLSEDLLDSMVPPHTPRKATSVSRSHHFCGFSKHKWLLGGKGTGRKKGSAKFDLHAKPRYSLIRKRDWRSGSALRSHRRGHWFEPSITHQ